MPDPRYCRGAFGYSHAQMIKSDPPIIQCGSCGWRVPWEGPTQPKRWLSILVFDEHDKSTHQELIGTLTSPTRLPEIVSCGTPGYSGPLCLQTMTHEDLETLPHLTTWSAYPLEKEQHAELLREGVVRIGAVTVRLMPEGG